jgi:hypothetical protein
LPRAFFFNAALLLITQFFVVGCSSENYLVHEVVKETIVEVEVPVYIETEIPTDNEDAEIWIDSFTQPRSVDGVDILWVIDTSGSMNRHDDKLLAGIEAMLNALPPSGWRLAMTSNDPTRAATESQFPLVPGDDLADAEAMYAAMGRGGREEGFDAAYEYIVNNPYASTWMRPDAALLIVFVSDEEDQSDSHFPAVQDFIDWYKAQRTGSAFLSSIINVELADTVCTSGPNAIDIGHRYMEATNWFGGVIVDICSDDWSPGVTDASVQLEPHEEWPLSYIPVEPTIRVFIDGQLNWDWVYDSAANVVKFTVIPSAAQLVEIGYIIDQTPGDDDDSADAGDTGDTG